MRDANLHHLRPISVRRECLQELLNPRDVGHRLQGASVLRIELKGSALAAASGLHYEFRKLKTPLTGAIDPWKGEPSMRGIF
jgi:hypothetical protein